MIIKENRFAILTNELIIDITDIIGHSEYAATLYCLEISSNHLIQIDIGDSKYILKIYCNKKYFEKELYFMYFFLKHKCKVPKLIKYSSTDSSIFWILYEHVEGISLIQIKKQLSTKELKPVWKQVGKELKKIHSISVFNQVETENNKMGFVRKVTSSIANFNNYLCEKESSEFLAEAILFLRSNISRINKSIYGIVLYDLNDKHIIVRQRKEKWAFNAFIDFEQTRFGCLYVDIAGLYISILLENKELEDCFWTGYDPEHLIFDDHCINFFLIYFGEEFCTVLREVNVDHYQWGLFIIEKTLDRIHVL